MREEESTDPGGARAVAAPIDMTTCPACGCQAVAGARFCSACGTALAPRTGLAIERRVVTTLFCDLVGFTALCESADAEDVDLLLRRYFAMARGVIELYGGVVEKFVGDAVVAVFGIPTAHEDDPERAVRAGLRLVESMSEIPRGDGSPQRIRVGINTGTALVKLDVDPSSGEGILVGDAINTAARLQTAAPPDGVVVGEMTHGLAIQVATYESLPPLTPKGKTENVRPWLVRDAIARTGIDLKRRFSTRLVGREVELGILKGLFEKTVASSSPQFALVVGEAGIGKSRLVFELARHLDEQPGLMAKWRQGRCPPYGEGLGYWPLGEIVKAQAGILEADAPDAAKAKLLAAVGDSAERPWMADRLLPLLGLEGLPATRDENFNAWQRFLESLAATSPVVLVFDDLHWASEGMLDFLDLFGRQAADVPLLVIGTARPEFLDAHPDFATRGTYARSWRESAVRIDLRSLSRGETSRLIADLQGAESLLEERDAIVERCGGNPLYTEELVRLLADERYASGRRQASRDDARARRALPESLQALIAARLDSLKPGHKALLADAAVIGPTFWPDAVAAMSQTRRQEVDLALGELASRELVRPALVSSKAGDAEYVFGHAVTRDVAYAQLPRGVRAAKHAVVARWIEATSDGRADDLAELLAHHYATALDLARAVEDDDLSDDLLGPTIRALTQAGNRALGLDVAGAERHYARAVRLAPAGRPERPRLMVSWGEALTESGRLEEAQRTLEEGIDALRAAGELRATALAMMRLSSTLYWRDGQVASRLRVEALALLEGDEPSSELAGVLEECAVQQSRDYDNEAAVASADRAIRLCAELGLPRPTRALSYRGCSRVELGDEAGLEDLRRAAGLAKRRGQGLDADIATYLLASSLFPLQGPGPALRARRGGLRFAERRGNHLASLWFREGCIEDLFLAGRWGETLTAIQELEPLLEEMGNPMDLWELRAPKAQLLLYRGDTEAAAPVAAWCVEHCRLNTGSLLEMEPVLAAVRLAQGDPGEALRLLSNVEKMSRGRRGAQTLAVVLPLAVRTAVQAGDPELAQRLMEGSPQRALESHTALMLRALLAERAGEREYAAARFAEAAARWRTFGVPWEEAQAHLGQGRCLVALRQTPASTMPLVSARYILTRLGARPALTEAEALLSGVSQPDTVRPM